MRTFFDETITTIDGDKGGGKGGGDQHVATEAPNTLQSRAIAKFVDLLCEGEIGGLVNGAKSIYLDKIPVQNGDGSYNFKGFSYQMVNGLPDQPYMPGFDAITNENTVSQRVKYGQPIEYRTLTDGINAVIVTLQIPALSKQDKKNGDMNGYNVAIAIDVKDLSNGANPYVTRIANDYISGKCTSPYERSYRIELNGTGPYLVRMRRLSSDSDNDVSIQDKTYFAHITEVIDHRISYDDSAAVGVRIDSEQFGTNIPERAYEIYGLKVRYPSNYNPTTRIYTGFWDGTWSYGYCNNPAWVFMAVATHQRYGVGIDDSFIDKWGLYELAQYCDQLVPDGFGGTEPRFVFNGAITSREEAYKVLQGIASMMRAVVFYSAGAVIIRQDKPLTPNRLFTLANVEGEFNYASSAKKARHTVAHVQWINPVLGYERDYEVYEDRDAILKYGYNPLSIAAYGTTSRGQAYRLGKWAVQTDLMNTETVQFVAGFEGGDVLPGDIIEIADPAWASADFGGRILDTTMTTVKLDRPLDFAGATTPELHLTLVRGAYDDIANVDNTSRPARREMLYFSSAISAYDAVNNIVTLATPLTVMPGDIGRTNKCTNYNANPTNLTGLTLVGPGVGSVVTDTAALDGCNLPNNKPLSSLCTTHKAYKIDNSGGGSQTTVYISGFTGNTNKHSWSVYARATAGTPSAGLENSGATVAITSTTSYQRYSGANITPLNNSRRVFFSVPAGAVLYFVLNQLEEEVVVTDPIVVAGAAASTQRDLVPIVWIFSKSQVQPREFKVIGIQEKDKGKFKITAINYDATKFAKVDENVIIEATGSFSDLPNTSLVEGPTNLTVTYESSLKNGVLSADLNVDWQKSQNLFLRGYYVAYKRNDDNWVQLPMTADTNVTLNDMPAGKYWVKVRAANKFGALSAELETSIDIVGEAATNQNLISNIISDRGDATFIDTACKIKWSSSAMTKMLSTTGLVPLPAVGWKRPLDSGNNVLRYTELLTNATYWPKSNIVTTDDGTLTPNGYKAILLAATSTSTWAHFIKQTITSSLIVDGETVYISASVKDAGNGHVNFNFRGKDNINYWANYTFSTGVIATSAGTVTMTATDAGGGFTRLDMACPSGTGATVPELSVYPSDGNTLVGNSVAGVYFGELQLNETGVELYNPSTDYRPTVTVDTSVLATPVISIAGLGGGYAGDEFTFNVGREQYYWKLPATALASSTAAFIPASYGAAVARSLLSDKVNNQKYSQTFTQTPHWSVSNVTLPVTNATAPDGTATATKIAETTANGAHAVLSSSGAVSKPSVAEYWVHSFYAKAAERSIAFNSLRNSTGNVANAYYDLSTGLTTQVGVAGTFSNAVAWMEDAGNGWWRCCIAAQTTSVSVYGRIGCSTTSGVETYAGTTGSGIYIWGSQIEAGAVPSAYIPTTTTALTGTATDYTVVTSESVTPATTGTATVSYKSTATNALDASAHLDPFFTSFIVNVKDPTTNTLLRTNTVTVPEYTYTMEKNVQDGGPRRSLLFEVAVQDVLGNVSNYATATISNAAPTLIAPTVQATINTLNFTFARPDDPDYRGIIVWMSTSPGVATINANRVWKDAGNPTIPVQANTTYYYKYAFYDAFGESGITISTEQNIVTPGLLASAFDTTPPATPTGLTLTPTYATDPASGQPMITLAATCTANTDSDLAGYEFAIQQGAGAFFEFPSNQPRMQWVVSANTAYNVKVRAVDKTGNRSGYTSVVPITTAKDATPPSAPTSLVVTNAFTSLFLAWSNPSDTDLSEIEVWENTTNSSGTATKIATIAAQPGAGGSFTRSGLVTGTTKWYFLKAVDTSGNASGFTTGVSGTTASLTAPDFTTGLQPVLYGDYGAAGASLPSTGNYEGRMVFNTNSADRKLYRYAGGGWTKAVDGGDITAGTITANAIAAGTITAAQIAVNTISASRLVIGDFSNLCPDPMMVDASSWTMDHGATFAAVSGLGLSAPVASTNAIVCLGSASFTTTITGTEFPVEGGVSYLMSMYFGQSASGVGLNAFSPRLYWYDQSGASILTSTGGGYDGLPGTTLGLETMTVTAPTGAAKAVFLTQYYLGSGTKSLYVTEPIFRRRNEGQMIVDGAIVTAHMTANTINGDRITTNTLDAAKITAGTILAGTITVSTNSKPLSTAHSEAVWPSISGTGKPADYATADITLTASTPANIAIVGNTATRVGGSAGAEGVYTTKITGPAYIGENIVAGVSYSQFGFDADLVGWAWNSYTALMEFVPSTGNWALYEGSTLRASGSVGGGATGKLLVTYDGVKFRALINGVEVGSFVASAPNLALYPKWNLYDTATHSGLTAGAYNDNSLSNTDPAARINTASTLVDPGKILISGATTLSSWRNGGDNTKIEGGSIAANTVQANSLTIGMRGLNIAGMEFQHNWNGTAQVTNAIAWTAGTIAYVNDSGTATTASISAGNSSWSSGTLYIYWTKGGTTLSVTTSYATANTTNTVCLASYQGGTNLVAEYGRTIIDGSKIVTGSIATGQLAANVITADKLAVGVLTGNLVLNPGAETGGTDGWTHVTTTATTTFSNSSADKYAGTRAFLINKSATSAQGESTSQAFAISDNKTYAVRVAVKGSAATASGLYLLMRERTSAPSGGFVTEALAISTKTLVSNAAVPSTWTLYEYTYTPTAGTTWASFSIRNFNVGPVNMYFDEVQVQDQSSSVMIKDGAIVAAKISVTTLSAITADVGMINAGGFTVNDGTGTGDPIFQVLGGEVTINSARIKALNVGAVITIGDESIKVALQSFRRTAKDGDVLSWPDLGNVPAYQQPIPTNTLAALGAGEVRYDCYLENLTSTGATARLKKVGTATPTSYSRPASGVGTNVSGRWEITKTDAASSTSGTYQYRVKGQHGYLLANPGKAGPPEVYKGIGLKTWFYDGSVWTAGNTYLVSGTDPASPSANTMYTVTYDKTFDVEWSTPLGTTAKFGVEIDSANSMNQFFNGGPNDPTPGTNENTITEFTKVTWNGPNTPPSSATASPNNETTVITIIPQNV